MLTSANKSYFIALIQLIFIAIPGFGQNLPSYQLSEYTIDPRQKDLHPTWIEEDSNGVIWVSMYDAGLYKVLGNQNHQYLSEPTSDGLCGNSIYTISVDPDNNLWFSTQSYFGVCFFNQKKNQFERNQIDSTDTPFMVYSIFHEDRKKTWMGCSDALYLYDSEKGYRIIDSTFNDVSHIQKLDNKTVIAFTKSRYRIYNSSDYSILDTQSFSPLEYWTDIPPIRANIENFLLARNKELIQINIKNKQITPLANFDDFIQVFLKIDDHYLGITKNGDAFLMDSLFNKYHIFKLDPTSSITQYYSDTKILSDGNIWFSWNGTMYILSPKIKMNDISVDSELLSKYNYSPYALIKNHLYRYENQVFVPLDKQLQALILPEHPVFNDQLFKSLYSDKSGNVWFQLAKKYSKASIIVKYNPDLDEIKVIDTLTSYRTFFQQDYQYNMWICTDENGIHIYDREDKKVDHITSKNSGLQEDWVNKVLLYDSKIYVGHRTKGLSILNSQDFSLVKELAFDPDDSNSINSNYVHEIYLDKEQMVWIGTADGLSRLNPNGWQIERWEGNSKLPSAGNIYNLSGDVNGNIWIELNNELFVLRYPEFNAISIPGIKQDQDYYFRGFFKNKDGNLFIPGDHGITTIDSSFDVNNLKASPTYITKVSFTNKQEEFQFYSRDQILNLNPIRVPFTFNKINFEFLLKNYTEMESHQFQYQLSGIENDWQILSHGQSVTYTNLNPGKYTFSVRGKNHLNLWSEQPEILSFTILPPWYWNIKSQIIYILLLGSLLYLFYQHLLNRKLAAQKKNFEVQKLAYKSQLYSNITHEFRSPLTIIKGLSDRLSDYFYSDQTTKFSQSLQLVRQNTDRLLSLVNQFLDFDRNFNSEIQVHNKFGDIVPFIGYILDSFKSMAIDNQQELIEHLPAETVCMDYDKDLIQKIISNLITNAIKYSPPFSTIKFNFINSDDSIKMEIIDQGKGIKKEDLPHIFERFYQSKEHYEKGSGIGLALTYEIIQKLEGQLVVSSEYGKGSIFTVSLPKSKSAESFHSLNLYSESPSNIYELENVNSNSELPVILIADDSEDVIFYLKECLENKYQLLFARDGEEGMAKTLKYIPDFIISDHLMPNVSGISFIQKIKDNRITSHIPILLLTAKTAEETRLQAYQAGADAFLEKPFLERELLLRIEKLIELRNNLRNHFRGDISNVPEKIEKKESEFILQFRNVVQNNIMQNLDVTFLCRELAISRTQLHRKVKALTDLSTTELVKKIKLEKARELLKKTDLTISEIAYDTGFSSPSYFSKMFTKEYAISPTQFRNH